MLLFVVKVGLCVLVLSLVDSVAGQTIPCQLKQNEVCVFECGAFGELDFTTLGSIDSVNADSGGHKFTFSPCAGVGKFPKCGSLSAVCQYLPSDPMKLAYNCGKISTGRISITVEEATLYYTGGQENRRTNILLTCIHNSAQNKLEFLSEQQHSYTLNLTHTLLCGPTHPPTKKSRSPLSTGSILLIVFASLLLVYFLGGAIILHKTRGATGLELIPNFQFWSQLPGLIKDGVLFLYNFLYDTCRSGCERRHSQYEKL